MSKKAIILGVNGQDGSYLSELLLSKGYEVHGVVRRSSQEPKNLENIAHLLGKIILHEGDLLDQNSLNRIVRDVQPDEVYNLAAQSHVAVSFNQPDLTANVTGLGHLRVLEAVRHHCPTAKVYFAASSEMFGDVAEEPQTEDTQLRARSPYGAAKIFGYHMTKVYRESYNIFACSGILFNHESPRRGLNFVTRKITHHIAAQVLGLTKEPLELGNLDSERDWGFAGDFVQAQWLMLQQDKPDDFVIATNETHTVREFVDAAYMAAANQRVYWTGHDISEIGIHGGGILLPHKYLSNCDPYVRVNPAFYRPADVNTLTGDYSKAKRVLGWEPKTKFDDLVKMMVESDLKLLGRK